MDYKQVRLTDDSLNSYGTRILTAGMDIEQYSKNPVLLYMHERGTVIGTMKDIEKRDGEIVGTPVFDECTELSKRCKEQWSKGSLKMVSVGIDILEWSDSPEHLMEGQTRPTVTKSKLFEVSIVDIGANDNAITLRHEGQTLELSADGDCPLPLLTLNHNNMEALQEEFDELKASHEALTATHEEMKASLEALTAENAELKAKIAEAEELNLAKAVEVEVDKAISEQRILATAKEKFMELGKKMGVEDLQTLLASITPRQTLASQISTEPEKTYTAKDWDEMDRKGTLAQFKKDQPEKFEELYKAKFGK